ncbi:CHAT domain-containing protein [Crassisporium funariophilum]|nr:CHAT domain-containing protein [Crassisporium funariophilum]
MMDSKENLRNPLLDTSNIQSQNTSDLVHAFDSKHAREDNSVPGIEPSRIYPSWSYWIPLLFKGLIFPPLAGLYRRLYSKHAGLRYLQASIKYSLAALATTPTDHPSLPHYQQRLGIALRERYKRLGDSKDLQLALLLQTRASATLPSGHQDVNWHRQNLDLTYTDRFRRLGNPADLDSAIALEHLAISELPTDSPRLSWWYYSLATSYHSRYSSFGSTSDIDAEIKWSLAAVDATPQNDPLLPSRQNTLALAYSDQYTRSANSLDLDLALFWTHSAVAGTPVNHIDYYLSQQALAVLYAHRYRSTGNYIHLRTALELCQNSLVAIPAGHPNLGECRHNLAVYHFQKYQKLGSFDDLALSIKWASQATQESTTADPGTGVYAGQLSTSYLERYQKSGALDDLESAMKYNEKAILTLGENHPKSAFYQHNYSIVFHNRFRRHRNRKDLDSAFYWSKSAITRTPQDDILYIDRQYSLAILYYDLFSQYTRLRELEDLENALDIGHQALALVPPDHPRLVRHWQLLGEAYAERFNLTHVDEDRREALRYFRNSTQTLNGDPSLLWKVARRWATFAELHQLPECLDAYASAYRILPELIWLGSNVASRHETMVKYEITAVTGKAIRACIKYENYALGVEFLEQSLAITFQQLLDLQIDLSTLKERFPSYAEKLESISKELQTAAISTGGESGSTTMNSQSTQWDRQRKLAIERETLLKTIRQLPEFENFLLPVPFKSLASSAKDGPIVMINCSETKSDALVLLRDGQTIHVDLPGVTTEKASKQCDNLRAALQFQGIHSRKAVDADRAGRRIVTKGPDGETMLESVLKWIWTFIVSPIFQELKLIQITEGRVWWCLTGPLTYLPVHAAGPPNNFVQSYTSTLGALLRARSPHAARSEKIILTAVGLYEFGTGGKSSLPNVKLEIEVLREVVGQDKIMVLMNEEATLDQVAIQLSRSTWLHLACHGQQGNTQDPLRSGLVLYNDAKLDLERIISTPIPAAEFVFLSACETAMGDVELTNESLHLAGGMIFAGFKATIGTLWSMNDNDGPVITKAVYTHLFKEREPNVKDTAEALHKAVNSLRAQGAPSHRWVPFIHIGI